MNGVWLMTNCVINTYLLLTQLQYSLDFSITYSILFEVQRWRKTGMEHISDEKFFSLSIANIAVVFWPIHSSNTYAV
jgi:hypothetical protein